MNLPKLFDQLPKPSIAFLGAVQYERLLSNYSKFIPKNHTTFTLNGVLVIPVHIQNYFAYVRNPDYIILEQD